MENTINVVALQSERIKLRLLKISDLDTVHALHSSPEVDQYNTLGIRETLDQTRNLISHWIKENDAPVISNYTFTIEKTNMNQFIGLIALKLGKEKCCP